MKPAVNFEDRLEVAEWFASIMERAYELADIAAAANKPRRERLLSRAALRRELEVTFGELRQLCRAGRRGIRTPPDTRTQEQRDADQRRADEDDLETLREAQKWAQAEAAAGRVKGHEPKLSK